MFKSNSITVTNLQLIAALLTVGAKIGEKPVNIKSSNGDRLTFFFEDNRELDEYLKIWNDEKYREEQGNKGNVFAFIVEAFKTREEILNSIKQFKKIAVLQKNGRTAIISEDCSDEVKKNILARL